MPSTVRRPQTASDWLVPDFALGDDSIGSHSPLHFLAPCLPASPSSLLALLEKLYASCSKLKILIRPEHRQDGTKLGLQ